MTHCASGIRNALTFFCTTSTNSKHHHDSRVLGVSELFIAFHKTCNQDSIAVAIDL